MSREGRLEEAAEQLLERESINQPGGAIRGHINRLRGEADRWESFLSDLEASGLLVKHRHLLDRLAKPGEP